MRASLRDGFQWDHATAKCGGVKVRASLLLVLSLLATGCGQRTPAANGSSGSTTPPYVRDEADPSLLDNAVVAVRVGDLGPNFAACNARGATRDRAPGGPVPVRSVPYEPAGAIDQLQPGAQFFICSRTHDQRWFGIVYDQDGSAAARCGVSGPVPARRNYEGPCAAGWVPSARIRLISGVPHQLTADVAAPVQPAP
jgi:hypothetical protein